MTEKVTKLAFASRLIVLLLQLLSNICIPDHKPDVFRAVDERALRANATHDAVLHASGVGGAGGSSPSWLDKTLQFTLGGLRHWDGEYFLHISEHTYTYENTLAFYPLYPMLVRTAAQALHSLGLGLTLRSCALLAAVLINIACFCQAANTLYALTQRIFNDLNKSWNAALLFCFNPASIFFTAAYSEALFAAASLHLMYECVAELRFVRSTAALALSIVGRSNGLVNAGFPIYFSLRKLFLRPVARGYSFLRLLASLLAALVPLSFFYCYAYQQFCVPDRAVEHSAAVVAYARERNYILAGHRQPQHSPWCDSTPLPTAYAYIQSHYWHVGFLRYYQFKQLPNFLLAAPILAFLFYHCYAYLRQFIAALWPQRTLLQLLKEYKSLPFVLHALFLTAFCALFVHIQVATRLLCSATPCLYWFAADHLPRTLDMIKLRSKAGLIVIWFGSYYLVGTVAFSNNLPWT